MHPWKINSLCGSHGGVTDPTNKQAPWNAITGQAGKSSTHGASNGIIITSGELPAMFDCQRLRCSFKVGHVKMTNPLIEELHLCILYPILIPTWLVYSPPQLVIITTKWICFHTDVRNSWWFGIMDTIWVESEMMTDFVTVWFGFAISIIIISVQI